MLLQTNSYIVPKERRAEHQRLLRRFRQTLARLGCEHFEVYEQVGTNWTTGESTGRFVQIMRFRDRRHQLQVQAAERNDPGAQAVIAEFCNLINFPYQQQQGLFAVGYYTSAIPVATPRRLVQEVQEVYEEEQPAESAEGAVDEPGAVAAGEESVGEEAPAEEGVADQAVSEGEEHQAAGEYEEFAEAEGAEAEGTEAGATEAGATDAVEEAGAADSGDAEGWGEEAAVEISEQARDSEASAAEGAEAGAEQGTAAVGELGEQLAEGGLAEGEEAASEHAEAEHDGTWGEASEASEDQGLNEAPEAESAEGQSVEAGDVEAERAWATLEAEAGEGSSQVEPAEATSLSAEEGEVEIISEQLPTADHHALVGRRQEKGEQGQADEEESGFDALLSSEELLKGLDFDEEAGGAAPASPAGHAEVSLDPLGDNHQHANAGRNGDMLGGHSGAPPERRFQR